MKGQYESHIEWTVLQAGATAPDGRVIPEHLRAIILQVQGKPPCLSFHGGPVAAAGNFPGPDPWLAMQLEELQRYYLRFLRLTH